MKPGSADVERLARAICQRRGLQPNRMVKDADDPSGVLVPEWTLHRASAMDFLAMQQSDSDRRAARWREIEARLFDPGLVNIKDLCRIIRAFGATPLIAWPREHPEGHLGIGIELPDGQRNGVAIDIVDLNFRSAIGPALATLLEWVATKRTEAARANRV